LGAALILAIIEQVRDRDEQTRAAASAEARALQARMNPHFLFNALNTLAALSMIAPRKVPRVVRRLRQFLRASFDQHERLLVTMEEELGVEGSGSKTAANCCKSTYTFCFSFFR
jgi:LytS/YehU family sensor histidine kinase